MSKLLRKIKKFIPVLSEPIKKMPELPQATPCHVNIIEHHLKPIMLKQEYKLDAIEMSSQYGLPKRVYLDRLKSHLLQNIAMYDVFNVCEDKDNFGKITRYLISIRVLPAEQH